MILRYLIVPPSQSQVPSKFKNLQLLQRVFCIEGSTPTKPLHRKKKKKFIILTKISFPTMLFSKKSHDIYDEIDTVSHTFKHL